MVQWLTRRAAVGVGAVLEQDWLDVGMASEEADQLRAAIAPEADDAYGIIIHSHE